MEKQRRLVETLLERTMNGLIAWKETADNGTYQVSFASNSVQIKEGGENNADFVIDLINDEGVVVDSFSDVDIGGSMPAKYFVMMKDLYQRARRIALGSEQILDDILGELTQFSRRSPR
jgi:hypothetical protein